MDIQKKLRGGDIIRVLNRKQNTLMFPGIYKVTNIMNGMMCYQMGESFGFLELESLGDYEKLNIKASKINWDKQQKEFLRNLEEFQIRVEQGIEVLEMNGIDEISEERFEFEH